MPLPKPATKTGSTFLDRRFEELIDERALDLAELKMQMNQRGLQPRDNIALVRYLCSFGSVQHTLEALKAAEAVAKEKAEVLRAAEEGRPLACAARVEPHQQVLSWKVSEDQVFYIIRVAHVDCRQLLKSASVDEIIDYSLHLCRSMWLWVDRTSRRLGRIRKYDVLMDFHGYAFNSWANVPPATYRQAMNRVSEMSEVLHPLSMGGSTLLGLPGAAFAKRVISIARPFLPKSLADAQLCLGSRKQSISICPYVAQRIAGGAAALPLFLGGSCPATGATLGSGQELPEAPPLDEDSSPSARVLEQFEALLADSADADAAAKAASEVGLGVTAAGTGGGAALQKAPPVKAVGGELSAGAVGA